MTNSRIFKSKLNPVISHVHDCQLSVYIQSSTSGWLTKESSNLLLGVREHLGGGEEKAQWGVSLGQDLRAGASGRVIDFLAGTSLVKLT